MTQISCRNNDLYRWSFENLISKSSRGQPNWLKLLREKNMNRFETLGFPTERKGNEEWKYTDVKNIATTDFLIPSKPTLTDAAEKRLSQQGFGKHDFHQLVFLDGFYSAELSSEDLKIKGCIIGPLSQAWKSHAVRSSLGTLANSEDHAFTALNTAFARDGAFIHIPANTEIEKPINIIFLTLQSQDKIATHPRTLINVGKNSSAIILETHCSTEETEYLSNAVSEISLEDGSHLDHYRLQLHSKDAYHIGTTQVHLNRTSKFKSVSADLGGKLIRNNLNVDVAGENASCILNGLYITNGNQHVDNHVTVDHSQPYTNSREHFKGILGDKSKTAFQGSIIIRENSQKVDSHQENKNLLLSRDAEANTKPAFWIYADDVKCGHGASVGELDKDALFYLLSRGIREKEAQTMLIKGFITEIIESVDYHPYKSYLDDLVKAKLSKMCE